MSRNTRRGLLVGAGTVLVAGCSGGDDEEPSGGNQPDEEPDAEADADNDGVPDSEDDYPNDDDLSTTLDEISDTRQIPEDEWYAIEFDISQPSTIQYQFTVREGPEIDVYLFSADEYQSYSDGERARFFGDGSVEEDVGGEAEITVESGEYRLVFDNTDFGSDPPANLDDDVAEVEFEVLAAR